MSKPTCQWLMKSEPETFSIDDLKNSPQQSDIWDGVRNYQARNFMRQMKVGDKAFFYHSNCKTPGIVGYMEITQSAFPDPTAIDSTSPYFDEKSTPEKNRWSVVQVTYLDHLPCLSLHAMKSIPDLIDFPLTQKGNRLSILPITPTQSKVLWQHINTP